MPQFAASDVSVQQNEEPSDVLPSAVGGGGENTTPSSGSFKDKLKGFVTGVKDGAADAYESVSDSVSGAVHKADEKRKEVVASTKKLVNSAIDKIKNQFKQDSGEEHEVPRLPENVGQSAEVVAENAKVVAENAKVIAENAKTALNERQKLM